MSVSKFIGRPYYLLPAIALIFIIMSVLLDTPLWWSLLLLSIPLLAVASYYPTCLFYSCFFLLPLSIELELPMGLTTDLVSEQILWVLFLFVILLVLRHGLPHRMLHPITLLIGVHVFWIYLSSIFSAVPIVSMKYFLSKLWFIIPVAVFPFFIRGEAYNIRLIAKAFVSGSLIAGSYYMFKFYQADMAFDARVNAGSPIWRNHVNYACTLLLALPLVIFLYRSSIKGKLIYFILGSIILVMIYHAYARVSYLALMAWMIIWFVIRLRLIKTVVLIILIGFTGGIGWLVHQNKYLDLASDYETTVTQHNFDDLITATTRKQDISSMERVYRWVAGANMIVEKPMTGWGPGSFYSQYKAFTLHRFRTYVSDNPDRSGIHSYFLMIAVEQGIPGLMIWLILIYISLSTVQRLYHEQRDGARQDILFMVIGILAVTIAINLINDMVEVIQMGVIFWWSLGLLVWFENKGASTRVNAQKY